jgi:antitoxin component YwqK of YwqJK toxin-antitoxin module
MKKILVFITLFTISCQNTDNEILDCTLDVQNGKAYVEGKLYSGICNIFDDNSALWKTRTYKRGELRKEISYYIPSGELEYIGHRKDGRIHGDFESYYKNGNMSIQGQLIQGQYDGEWTYWDEDGQINKELTYDMGTVIDSTSYKE